MGVNTQTIKQLMFKRPPGADLSPYQNAEVWRGVVGLRLYVLLALIVLFSVN